MNLQDLTKLLEDNEISSYKKFNIIKDSLDDDGKVEIIHNPEFIRENNIQDYQIREIIESLGDEKKTEVLLDKDFLEHELILEEYQIVSLISSLES